MRVVPGSNFGGSQRGLLARIEIYKFLPCSALSFSVSYCYTIIVMSPLTVLYLCFVFYHQLPPTIGGLPVSFTCPMVSNCSHHSFLSLFVSLLKFVNFQLRLQFGFIFRIRYASIVCRENFNLFGGNCARYFQF